MSKHSDEMRKQRMRKRARGIARTVEPESRELAGGIPEQYLGVLQTIELMLLGTVRADRRIDDSVMEAGLVAAIEGRADEDEVVAKVIAGLDAVRASRPDMPLPAWRDCLRTILDTLRLHSTRRPGDYGYLLFISPY
jgi:glycerate kinase